MNFIIQTKWEICVSNSNGNTRDNIVNVFCFFVVVVAKTKNIIKNTYEKKKTNG